MKIEMEKLNELIELVQDVLYCKKYDWPDAISIQSFEEDGIYISTSEMKNESCNCHPDYQMSTDTRFFSYEELGINSNDFFN